MTEANLTDSGRKREREKRNRQKTRQVVALGGSEKSTFGDTVYTTSSEQPPKMNHFFSRGYGFELYRILLTATTVCSNNTVISLLH